ncbi:MAG: SLC13 family permease, partial [Phycisphaerales bacterium]
MAARAEDHAAHSSLPTAARAVQWCGFFAGPLLALLVYRLAPETLSEPGRRVLFIVAWMAVWWVSEAIPISATALLPLLLMPLLGVSTMAQAAAPYADEVIFLFVGGFILGEALRSSGLHRRIAICTLLGVGTRPASIVGGIMLVTYFVSMWVSNTATTIMMLPIGLSLVGLVERYAATEAGARSGWTPTSVRNLSIAVVLGTAYAASIGGMGSPIGTPPNVIMRGQAAKLLGREIDFLTWVLVAGPVSIVLAGIAWLVLTRVVYPVRAGRIKGGHELLREEKRALGRTSA